MNFLQAYHIYSSGNEAPAEFHQWGAFAALSACCGPRLWADFGGVGNIQPNLFILFVSPPGIKKSTAKDFARDLIRAAATPTAPIPIAPASTSKEAFIEYLADPKSPCQMAYKWEDKLRKYTKCSIFSNEFVNLVQVGGDPLAWIQILTDIYDPQPNYDVSTISRGAKNIPFPYITLLGCMTPELTKSLINENALSGGFSRRVIYIYANKKGPPVPRPVTTPEQLEAKRILIEHCQRILTLQGRFEFSQEAIEAYDSWYHENYNESEKATSAAVVNFLQSKAILIIKVAMLCHLSWSSDLIIEKDDLETAIALVSLAQRHIDTIFAGVGRNPHAATMAGIQQFIKLHCENAPHYVLRKKIYANFLAHAQQKDIDILIDQMTAIEQIKQVTATFNNGQTVQVVTTPEFYMTFAKKT